MQKKEKRKKESVCTDYVYQCTQSLREGREGWPAYINRCLCRNAYGQNLNFSNMFVSRWAGGVVGDGREEGVYLL